jgi:serine/threonine protein kinase
MAATMASGGAAVLSSRSVVTSAAFPVPNWDRYEFISTLGRGGMGSVYKARDRRLGRIVALKFIHGDDPGLIQRFLQEARAQARLTSPHICKIHEAGFVDSKPYIAMELVDGASLDKAGPSLSLVEKVQVTRDVAMAMHLAHEEGIVHRVLQNTKKQSRNRDLIWGV